MNISINKNYIYYIYKKIRILLQLTTVNSVDRRDDDYRAIFKSIDRPITTVTRLKFEHENKKTRDCGRAGERERENVCV